MRDVSGLHELRSGQSSGTSRRARFNPFIHVRDSPLLQVLFNITRPANQPLKVKKISAIVAAKAAAAEAAEAEAKAAAKARNLPLIPKKAMVSYKRERYEDPDKLV